MEHQAILWCNQLVVQVSEFFFSLEFVFGPSVDEFEYMFCVGFAYSP